MRWLGRPTSGSDADRRQHGRDDLLIRAVQGDDFGQANRKTTTGPQNPSPREESWCGTRAIRLILNSTANTSASAGANVSAAYPFALSAIAAVAPACR